MEYDITVVVPVYNLKNFLTRCLNSLLVQDLYNYEIILVDDGSTDGSEILCDEYANRYPDVVKSIHKGNGGLSSARNAGIEEARGKYIVFPDPDDWTDPDYLSQLWKLQMKFPVDLVCTGYIIEFDNKSIPVNAIQQLQILSSTEAQEALLTLPGIGGFAWNKLYHLDIIRNNNLRFLNDVGTTEDLDFSFRYLKYCRKVCVAPELSTYHYYQRSGAATHGTFSKRKLEAIHTYEKIIDMSEKNSRIVTAAKEEICNMSINLIWMYFDAEVKDESSYKKIRENIKKYYLSYIKSSRYSKGRKLQAILARYLPMIYWRLRRIYMKKRG